jgi:tetratricopeptide (TPR) repeat protein
MTFAQWSTRFVRPVLALMLVLAPVFQGCSSPNPTAQEASAPTVSAKRFKDEAKSKFEKKDYQGAVTAWTQFLEANANKESEEAGYYNRGRAHRKLNNPQAAEKDFSEALKIDPASAKTYVSRAEVRAEQKNQAGAIADYQKSIELYQKQGKEEQAKKTQRQLEKLQQGTTTSKNS